MISPSAKMYPESDRVSQVDFATDIQNRGPRIVKSYNMQVPVRPPGAGQRSFVSV